MKKLFTVVFIILVLAGNIYAMDFFTSDPTVNDDYAHGYRVGNEWFNTNTQVKFLCDDATTGAAVWSEVVSGGTPPSDAAYDESTWDGVTTVAPSKNAVRDKFESLSSLYTWQGEWVSNNTPGYNANDIVMVTDGSDYHYYSSIAGSNLNNTPTTQADSEYWYYVGSRIAGTDGTDGTDETITIVNHTIDETITCQNNDIHTNNGAGEITLSLNAMTTNQHCSFLLMDAQRFNILPAVGTDIISITGASAGDGIYSAIAGSLIELVSTENGVMVPLNGNGAWTIYTVAADCPSGTYKFYWDGDHSSGSTYACTANGTGTLNGSNSGGTIGAFGVTGNAFRKSAHDQYIAWTITADDILDDAAGTIWMKIKADSDRTALAVALEATVSSTPTTDDIKMIISDTTLDRIQGHYEGDNDAETIDDSANAAVVPNTWTVIGYTWNQSGSVHCVTDGDGTWRCSSSDTLTILAPASDELVIGERRTGGAETTTDTIFDIDEVYITGSYQSANPF